MNKAKGRMYNITHSKCNGEAMYYESEIKGTEDVTKLKTRKGVLVYLPRCKLCGLRMRILLND